jgi:phage pi2 protein 07
VEISQTEFNNWLSSDKFKEPTTENDLYTIIILFFKRIRTIISVENHHKKYWNPSQIVDILNDSAEWEGINLYFSYFDAQWYVHNTKRTTKEDILQLPRVEQRFKSIYRHHASDYFNDNLKELL